MPMVDIDWLKDHVEVPEGLTYEQLAKDLVKVGLEEEEIHTSQLVGPIVVGYVVDATPEPQKNGKIINWCHVDVGDEYNETDENGNKVPRGIICGAPNMKAGEKVVVVDDLSYGKPTRIEGSRLYGMDIAAPGAGERLAEIMKAEGVDSVIHFAARKQVGESVEKPLWYYQQNINGMLNVLIGMRDSGAKKLVFSSSAATYGVPPVDVVPEDVVPMLPINPYGQTKLFGEWMARACEEPYGIRFCGLRYFNVAGCGPVELEDPAILNLIPMLFDRLKKGKAPAIFGDDYPTPDGTCVRDYIHVSDLADAHIAALKYLDRDERKYDAFNVGTGEGTSVRQIVDEVKKVTGLPFTEAVMARRAGDPSSTAQAGEAAVGCR